MNDKGYHLPEAYNSTELFTEGAFTSLKKVKEVILPYFLMTKHFQAHVQVMQFWSESTGVPEIQNATVTYYFLLSSARRNQVCRNEIS